MQGTKILFAVSEFSPFARTGDLAESAAGLCHALREAGADVRVIMPFYRGIETDRREVLGGLPVPVSSKTVFGRVWESASPSGTPVYLLEQSDYFDRDGLYNAEDGKPYGDNAERFIFFSRAVIEFIRRGPFRPEIVHANDWFTGLAPVYMKTLYAADEAISPIRSVFTIHDIAYQGIFWHHDMHLTGFSWDLFRFDKLEFFGKLNFMKGGIVFADAVTTVSRNHAEEIRVDRVGCGLEKTLARRGEAFRGIPSGIDPGQWNPATDGAIASTYDAASFEGKAACRTALQRLANLPEDDRPLLGMIGPFTRRNGFDLAGSILDRIVERGVRIVAMGEGASEILDVLRGFARARPLEIGLMTSPPKSAIHGAGGREGASVLGGDRMSQNAEGTACHPGAAPREELLRRLLAGADLLLAPARFGPGGLEHLRALRYGVLPVARRVGALLDAVREFDVAEGAGNGFLFVEPSAEDLLSALDRALAVLRHPEMRHRAIENAMATDVSWRQPAVEYIDLYKELINKSIP